MGLPKWIDVAVDCCTPLSCKNQGIYQSRNQSYLRREKAREVQVEALETPPMGRPTKIDYSLFINSLPGNIKKRFAAYLDRWMNAGYEIHWGTVGLSFNIRWKGKTERLFDALPYTTGIISERGSTC